MRYRVIYISKLNENEICIIKVICIIFFQLSAENLHCLEYFHQNRLTSRANLISSSRIRFFWPYMNVLCQLISFWSLEGNTSFDK